MMSEELNQKVDVQVVDGDFVLVDRWVGKLSSDVDVFVLEQVESGEEVACDHCAARVSSPL